MLSNLNVEQPMSVLGIARHFVAIYGANSGQEGASLLLYNTQFKVIKAKQFFKVYFDFSRLWAAQHYILLAMGQNLSVVSYSMSKELLLAELIGTQTETDYKKPVEAEYINEEEYLQESLKYASGDQEELSVINNNIENTNNATINFKQADGKYVPFESVNEFEKKLQELSQLQLQVELLQIDRSLEDVNITLMTNCQDQGFITTEANIIARHLERHGASEQEISEKLLSILIKANLMQDIGLCLRRYNNISEKMLAKTLSYILTHFDASYPKEESLYNNITPSTKVNDNDIIPEPKEEYPIINLLEESSNEKDSQELSTYQILNILLSCSFDEASITPHIRREIDYAQCLVLMQHLYHLLTSNSSEANLELHPNNFEIDTEFQILHWFGIILNTHFQKLALSKDETLIDLLCKWQQLFGLYRKELKQLQQVSALLYSLVEAKKISKEKNYSKWYSIEEVVLF